MPFSRPSIGLLRYLVLFNLVAFPELLSITFDVIHCRDLDILLAGFFAGKLKDKEAVYDGHEIYLLMTYLKYS